VRLAAVIAAVVVVSGAAIYATVWAIWFRVGGPTLSRQAADRHCERAFVEPAVAEPGTSVPALRLEQVASLEGPATVAFWPQDPSIGVVGERAGVLLALTDGEVDRAEPLVDVSADTMQRGDGGLISVAYSPDGEWLYVWRADAAWDDRLDAYPTPGGVPQAEGERNILLIDHPKSDQHHGGGLAFGPDGFLYVGVGDGGGLGDPNGNGQDLSTLLGKLLRLDPTPAADQPYRIPADNPFVDRDGARPEIYAYGLRNPFRLSFDSETGDLWLPDVGHSCWEEINFEPAGEPGGWNFGWDYFEGTHPFQGQGPGRYEEPIHDYAHLSGHCVIVGGYRYHGRAVPELEGAFLYSDYCEGGLLAIWYDPAAPRRIEATNVDIARPVAIYEGPDGEPWIASLDGGLFRLEVDPSPP
jgi:glucose/arabinose dehydrogenase